MNKNLPLPLVSVVMSVYNGRPYLVKAVKSILAQTFRDFEFIIIDDGSTDGSIEDLKRYAAHDSRIRLVIQENRGLTKSLNTGLKLACGKYIARMDADDISLPTRLQKQVAYLENNPSIAAVGCFAIIIDELGLKIARWNLFTSHKEIDNHNMKGLGGGIIHPSVMMRKEIVISIGGYNDDLIVAQDFDLWLRLAEVSKLANLPDYCLLYRRQLGSISIKKIEEQLRTALFIHTKACARRGKTYSFEYDINKLSSQHKDRISIRMQWINDAKYFGYWKGYLIQNVLLAVDEMREGKGLPFIKKIKRILRKKYLDNYLKIV